MPAHSASLKQGLIQLFPAQARTHTTPLPQGKGEGVGFCQLLFPQIKGSDTHVKNHLIYCCTERLMFLSRVWPSHCQEVTPQGFSKRLGRWNCINI